ncbi:MAG: hypothetical protein ABJE10_11370 [bacterium]
MTRHSHDQHSAQKAKDINFGAARPRQTEAQTRHDDIAAPPLRATANVVASQPAVSQADGAA